MYRNVGHGVFRLFMLAVMVVVSAPHGSAESTHVLSDHFVAKEIGGSAFKKPHLELYVREPDGKLTFIGATPDPHWAEKRPFGFKGLQSKYFAVSRDGKSIVYAHNFGPPEIQKYGVYFQRYNESARLVLEGLVGATDRGKPLPDHVVAIGTKGVTTNGEIVELALLEGSALHEAAFKGNVERIEGLVRGGHDLHAFNYWGHEPLELAIVRRHEAAAVRLIEYDAHEGPRAVMFLSLAAAYKLPETVRALLLRGTSVNAAGPQGLTPVHSALALPFVWPWATVIGAPERSEYGFIMPKAVEVLRLILAHGGDPNVLSKENVAPLDLVARRNYYWWDQRDHPELREELRRLLNEAASRP